MLGRARLGGSELLCRSGRASAIVFAPASQPLPLDRLQPVRLCRASGAWLTPAPAGRRRALPVTLNSAMKPPRNRKLPRPLRLKPALLSGLLAGTAALAAA